MKLHAFSLCVFACTACAFDVDDYLDRLDTALSISAFHDNLRVRLSGTLDLEIYNFEQPAPGLIDSNIDTLFNPRLTLFLDAQIGSQIYFFAQSRLDRGFDPSDHGAQVRLDEYAAAGHAVGGWSLYGANRQVRYGRWQLGSAALVVGEPVCRRTTRL